MRSGSVRGDRLGQRRHQRRHTFDAKLKKGKPGKKGKEGKPTYEEDYTELGGEQDLVTTFFNPETSKVESGASIQEGTNNVVDRNALEKGFEISSLGL